MTDQLSDGSEDIGSNQSAIWLAKYPHQRVSKECVTSTQKCDLDCIEPNEQALPDIPHDDGHHQRPLTIYEAVAVQKSVGMAIELFPEFATDLNLRHRMVKLAEEAYKLADETYTMADAEAWADSFT